MLILITSMLFFLDVVNDKGFQYKINSELDFVGQFPKLTLITQEAMKGTVCKRPLSKVFIDRDSGSNHHILKSQYESSVPYKDVFCLYHVKWYENCLEEILSRAKLYENTSRGKFYKEMYEELTKNPLQKWIIDEEDILGVMERGSKLKIVLKSEKKNVNTRNLVGYRGDI